MGTIRLFVKVAKDGFYLNPDGSPLCGAGKTLFAPCTGRILVGWDDTCAIRLPKRDGRSGVVVEFVEDPADGWRLMLHRPIAGQERLHLREGDRYGRDLGSAQALRLHPGDRGCLDVEAGISIDFSLFLAH